MFICMLLSLELSILIAYIIGNYKHQNCIVDTFHFILGNRFNNRSRQRYFGADAFNCFQCGRVYRNKQSLTSHMKYECNKDPQFVCKICGKSTYYPSNFKKHMVLSHQVFISLK